MAIVIKIRPVQVKAKTKHDLLKKISGNNSIWSNFQDTFSNVGCYLLGRGKNEGKVRLYSLEKHNRKVEVTKRTITRGKRKGEVEVTRKVIRESGWVGYYYELPKDQVDTSGTKQGLRSFTLKLK